MIARLTALAIGVVALLVGVVGLFSPVNISPGLTPVPCGTAVAPDLKRARTSGKYFQSVARMQDPDPHARNRTLQTLLCMRVQLKLLLSQRSVLRPNS